MIKKIPINDRSFDLAILNLILLMFFVLGIAMFLKFSQGQTKIVTVDIQGIMQEFIVKSAATKLEGDALNTHVKEFTVKFDNLTKELAQQENFMIVPKNAVIAGGIDITEQVKALLADNKEGKDNEKTK